MLSSRGGSAKFEAVRKIRELAKSEHSIELAQLASRVASAMHAETSNGDDLFAKVKGLISDMIARLEEKASADATHKAFEAKQIFNSTHSETEMMRYMTMLQHKDLSLTTSMLSFGSCIMQLNSVVYFTSRSWLEVMHIYPFAHGSSTIVYRGDVQHPWRRARARRDFDACSLQPTSGASGEYAGLLVIRKYQESIRQETEDTRRTEHMRSMMDPLYRRSLQFLRLDEHLAIRSAVMTTSDRWVILGNGSRMLEVTTKECHGLHRYDRVSLEGGTSSQSSFRRTMARISSWYNFQADEMCVSRVINQHTVQVVLTDTFDALGFSHISVPLKMHKLAPEVVIPLTTVKETVACLSTTENLELFVDGLEGHQNLPLKENRPKGLVIVDIELVAVKSCKSPDDSAWNGWQSIVMETEYGDAWVDKADENRLRLETYDTMRKTTESEREAEDQITEQVNKYARNGGRRYRRALT